MGSQGQDTKAHTCRVVDDIIHFCVTPQGEKLYAFDTAAERQRKTYSADQPLVFCPIHGEALIGQQAQGIEQDRVHKVHPQYFDIGALEQGKIGMKGDPGRGAAFRILASEDQGAGHNGCQPQSRAAPDKAPPHSPPA